MLPIFTTTQVKDGIDSGDLMIDLSEYIKKKDAATKLELSSLTSVVANKLDAEPQHKHHIQDIKDLQEELQSKYDTSEKYSFNTIISDIDKISYIEAPKIKMLEIVKDQNDSVGYKFYVNETNGDLMICSDDILLANYSKSSNNWSFGGVSLDNIPNVSVVNTEINNLKIADSNINLALSEHDERITANTSNINTVESIINELRAANETFIAYIAKTDAILKNHYDVLVELCEKHDIIDSNPDDEAKIN